MAKKVLSAKERRKLMKKKLIKRTKESLKRGQSGMYFKVPDGMDLYKPEKGDHFLDFIPYIVGDMDPNLDEGEPAYYLEVWVHKPEELDGTPTRLCNNKMYGRPCPKCEHIAVMKKEGGDEKLIKTLSAKRRELYNVRDISTEKSMEKVQIFEVSYHFMGKKLSDLIEGPVRPGSKKIQTTIDISSPDTDGRTIGFKVSPKTVVLDSGETITFPDYTGHRLLDRDEDIEDDVLMQTVALDGLLIQSTYEQQYAEYWGEDPSDAPDPDPDPDPDDDPDEKEEKEEKEEKSSKRPPLSKVTKKDKKDDDEDGTVDLDSMDKDELVDFMKTSKYRIRGYKKMDEDELRYEIEECMDDDDS